MGLCACGGLKHSIEDSERTTAALKAELGLDAHVSWRSVNGHTTVVVHLDRPPSGDAAVAKRNVTDVVNRNFRSSVERVDLQF